LAQTPRCVVLHHEGVPEPHFDVLFALSEGAPAPTWRASRWPPEPGDHLVRIADHRPFYLDHEGTVPGDRGTVRRVFADHCTHLHLQEGLLEATLSDGTELTLSKDSPHQWLCWLIPGRRQPNGYR
jgi:hypothetical protein